MQFAQRQWRLFAMVFVAVVTVLVLAYYFLIRVEMVPVYQNIRTADASAIVGALDQADIPYRLANDGHDILVPEDRASDARVAVAGSEIAVGGSVGFELFNDSDMGLTEFAQKINFQRAMQGELARTIMMMEGTEFARVHLAIPERSIFRAAQGEPTAAVTVQMRDGFTLTDERVDGIRQLVASSVPGLPYASVAVLDDEGDLLSGSAPVAEAIGILSERDAMEQLYRARARDALGKALAGIPYEVELSAVQMPSAAGDTASSDRGTPGRSNYYFTLLVRTPDALDETTRAAAEAALSDALELDRGRGDVLTFSVGAFAAASGARATARPAAPVDDPRNAATAETASSWDLVDFLMSRWGLIALALIAVIAFALRPRRRLADAEAASFAEVLKRSTRQQEVEHG